MATEEPDYTVLDQTPEFELRQYSGYIVAETVVTADFASAGNKAFRILAGYIFGNNVSSEKMAMTVPVGMRPASGETIDMTAPVLSTGSAAAPDGRERYVYSFVMPSGYTLDSLPTPNDRRVVLREVPPRLVAARAYSGTWSETRYEGHQSALIDAARAHGLDVVGPPEFARYNGPMTPWFLRRNEVLVEVTRPARAERGAGSPEASAE